MSAPATLDRVFDALANEARREIVTALSCGPAATPDLGEEFDISKQALSKHLQILEAAGLIARERRGRTDEVRLNPAGLTDISSWATSIGEIWNQNLDRLGRVLADSEAGEEA